MNQNSPGSPMKMLCVVFAFCLQASTSSLQGADVKQPPKAEVHADEIEANEAYVLNSVYAYAAANTKNWDEALSRIHEAANRNDPQAQNLLGSLMAQGKGVPKDDVEAVSWFRKAALQGYAMGYCRLAIMYAAGRGVPRDNTEAAAWVQKATKSKDAKVQCLLGQMYASGAGVGKDTGAAVDWYLEAAEQGDAEAQYLLGVACEYGEGIWVGDDEHESGNNAEAERWYLKAAGQGHAAAQYCLGKLMMANGSASQKVLAQSRAWLSLAELNGITDAKSQLDIVDSAIAKAQISFGEVAFTVFRFYLCGMFIYLAYGMSKYYAMSRRPASPARKVWDHFCLIGALALISQFLMYTWARGNPDDMDYARRAEIFIALLVPVLFGLAEGYATKEPLPPPGHDPYDY